VKKNTIQTFVVHRKFIRRKYFMQISYTIANGVYLSTRSVELFASPIIIIIIIWSQYTGKSGTQTSHLSRRPDVYIENRINHNLLGINYIYIYIYVRRVCIAKSIILSTYGINDVMKIVYLLQLQSPIFFIRFSKLKQTRK